MAANITRRVSKIDDQTLVQACKEIATLFKENKPNIGFDLLPGVTQSLEDLGDPAELAGRYSFETAHVVANIDAQVSFRLNFRRTIQEGGTQVSSVRYDEFDLSFGRDANHWKGRLDLVSNVNATIGRLGLSISPNTSEESVDTLRELVVGFGATHRHMLETLHEQIAANEAKRAEIDDTFDQREKERLAVHKKSLDEIEAERTNLNLQSYRSERRRVMQQMTNADASDLRKALTPKGAIITRWAVFAAALMLSAFATGLAYESIVQLGADETVAQKIIEAAPSQDIDAIRETLASLLGPTDWFLIGRSILSSLVAIGGLVYAAEWLRSFYGAELAAAREIDRFNYDLVRASWIIETILEVKHEHSGEVPQEWIEGVTRGLFDSSGSRETLDDGAQALRALMGFTASATFGPDGPKFDIGRRDARKLAKTVGGDTAQST